MRTEIAIEIGSSYTKIYKLKCDVVLYEPTIIAIKNGNYKKPYAVGNDALKLVGKTADGIKIIKPVNAVEILDFNALTALITAFVNKIRKPFESISRILLSVQCGSDGEVIRRFENALQSARLYNIACDETPVLSVLGVGNTLTQTSSNAIIDFGGGQTTICVLNLNGVISGVSVDYGGNDLNKNIIKHLEEEVNITISNSQAEALKRTVASLVQDDDTKTVVSGKETTSGKARTMLVSASMIAKPVIEFVNKIIEIASLVLNKLPDESVIELSRNGIILTGGGSNLYGLQDYTFNKLGYKIEMASEPELSSIIGAGKVLASKELLLKLKLKQ